MKKKYKYTNHKTGEIIEIYSHDIIAADKIYKEKIGIKVEKCSYIGCEIIEDKGGSN